MVPAEPHRSQGLWDERLCFHSGGGNPADSQHVFESLFPFDFVVVVLEESVRLVALWIQRVVVRFLES